MSEKRFRIAGCDSNLAQEYPEVARLLSMSGKSLSRICYAVISLYMRCFGVIPENKEDVKEFINMIETLNKHKAKPWLISSAALPFMTENAQTGDSYSDELSIGWDDPDMNQELI